MRFYEKNINYAAIRFSLECEQVFLCETFLRRNTVDAVPRRVRAKLCARNFFFFFVMLKLQPQLFCICASARKRFSVYRNGSTIISRFPHTHHVWNQASQRSRIYPGKLFDSGSLPRLYSLLPTLPSPLPSHRPIEENDLTFPNTCFHVRRHSSV